MKITKNKIWLLKEKNNTIEEGDRLMRETEQHMILTTFRATKLKSDVREQVMLNLHAETRSSAIKLDQIERKIQFIDYLIVREEMDIPEGMIH